LPFKDKMAKKLLYGVCHFEVFRIFNKKWQKIAKPTVNSRGILFLGWSRDAVLIRTLFCKFGYQKYSYLFGEF